MSSHHKPMYCLGLEIAGVSISLNTFRKWEVIPSFLPFVKNVETADYQVDFRLVKELPEYSTEILYEDKSYRIHSNEKDGYVRTFFDAPRDLMPYAAAKYDYINNTIQVDCLEKGLHCVSELHNGFFHIGFESILIRKERLCVHAACVSTPLGGILFSGPSGIGKSTQAELWCNYCGATVINGDRPILSKEESGWLAWGSPYAGSSRCHVNEKCPVTAIVSLQQAKECSLKRLHSAEAFREIWSGLTVYKWDKWFVERAADLILDLIETVPVFRFCCTPDKGAVEYLEQELRKECCL